MDRHYLVLGAWACVLAGCALFGLAYGGLYVLHRIKKKKVSIKKVILEKTAWPEQPIDQYESSAGKWGYLIIYSDISFEFLTNECPTEIEIYERWGHYLNGHRTK